MTNLYFIRHAHTVLNGKMLFQGGQTDSDLDDVGRQQLYDSKEGLNAILPKNYLLICSPLKRTRQTVDGLELNKDNMILDNRIREIDFGQWEGRSLEDVTQEYPAEVNRYYENDPQVTPPDGESIGKVAQRMSDVISEYSSSKFSDVVFVSHGNSISIGLSSLVNNEKFNRTMSIPNNVSLSEVVTDDNGNLQNINYYNRIFY